MCVLATILGAVDLGYRTVLVQDAVCSSSDESHEFDAGAVRQPLWPACGGGHRRGGRRVVARRTLNERRQDDRRQGFRSSTGTASSAPPRVRPARRMARPPTLGAAPWREDAGERTERGPPAGSAQSKAAANAAAFDVVRPEPTPRRPPAGWRRRPPGPSGPHRSWPLPAGWHRGAWPHRPSPGPLPSA